MSIARLDRALASVPSVAIQGRVAQVLGLVIESDGPRSRIGDVCIVEPGLRCEVVGFRDGRVLMMPLGEMTGVQPGALVKATGDCLKAPSGPALKGRVLDGLGRPMDDLDTPCAIYDRSTLAAPPQALKRQMIETPLATGVRAIDGLATLGEGQRIGIFAGSGVGKSTLLGMIARSSSADVNVIALVGERGREVKEFIERDLGPEGMAKSVIVCATSDESPLVRIKAALVATAIAESFRDQGERVMLMMDSVTRYAMALREVGLTVGEPPSTKGYPPSVFAALPRLMERAGMGERGSITAIYTVLVDGDDTNEPIADAARSILDGHVVLERSLAEKGHYPPISPNSSLSRVMPAVVPQEQVREAQRMRELMGAYREVEDLLSVGAYKEGSKPLADEAIKKWPAISEFLCQDRDEAVDLEETRRLMKEIVDA